jgi:hypothetical protein
MGGAEDEGADYHSPKDTPPGYQTRKDEAAKENLLSQGVHTAKARKVSTTLGPGKTMSAEISGGSKMSKPVCLTSAIYRVVAPRLSSKTLMVIPTHFKVGI